MAKNFYSDDVWLAIRTLWESTIKISWREVLEQVSDAFNCEVPSVPTASEKCKRQKWKKSAKIHSKVKANFSEKISNTEIEKNKLKTMGYSDFIREGLNAAKSAQNTENPTLTLDEFLQVVDDGENQQVKVIKRHRKRSELMGNLQDRLLSDVDELLSLRISVDDADFEEKVQKQMKLTMLFEKKSNIVMTLSVNNKNNQESDFKAWGIKEIESESSVSSRKQDFEAMEEDLATQRAAIRHQQEVTIKERRAQIEKGYWMERTQEEVDASIEADEDELNE